MKHQKAAASCALAILAVLTTSAANAANTYTYRQPVSGHRAEVAEAKPAPPPTHTFDISYGNGVNGSPVWPVAITGSMTGVNLGLAAEHTAGTAYYSVSYEAPAGQPLTFTFTVPNDDRVAEWIHLTGSAGTIIYCDKEGGSSVTITSTFMYTGTYSCTLTAAPGDLLQLGFLWVGSMQPYQGSQQSIKFLAP